MEWVKDSRSFPATETERGADAPQEEGIAHDLGSRLMVMCRVQGYARLAMAMVADDAGPFYASLHTQFELLTHQHPRHKVESLPYPANPQRIHQPGRIRPCFGRAL